MRAKKIAASLAATAILIALVLPSGASAKPRRVHQPAAVDAQIQGRSSDGFRFDFVAFGPRASILLLSKRVSQFGDESVDYFFRPPEGHSSFDAGKLDARIGGLGRLRARFVPSSAKEQKPRKGCTGDPTITETGFFVGSFSFRGERGYATIHSHRERGTVTRQGATSCPAPSSTGHRRYRPPRATKERREGEENEFRLLAGDPDEHILLQASREESAEEAEGSPTTFRVTVSERVGRLQIDRSSFTLLTGPQAEATFLTPNATEPLAEATLEPPAPFLGSATFHLDDPHTASWTGDLAVELPGMGSVPLTGEGIEAGLCKGPSNCTETLTESLQKQLEAGLGAFVVVTEAKPKRGTRAPAS